MNPNYLDFEQPIADLEAKIQELRQASHGPEVNIDSELHALHDKLRKRTAHIFRDLTPWQVSQLARHPARARISLPALRMFSAAVSTIRLLAPMQRRISLMAPMAMTACLVWMRMIHCLAALAMTGCLAVPILTG